MRKLFLKIRKDVVLMGSFANVKRKYESMICRRCINEEFSAALTPNDCIYGYPFPMNCNCCKEMRNIVTNLRLSGKIKLLFKSMKD